jgi:hypothetical protein
MVDAERKDAISRFLEGSLRFEGVPDDTAAREETRNRLAKALSLLPEDAQELFLRAERRLTLVVKPDTAVPLGMTTAVEGPKKARSYVIIIYEEDTRRPEDLFVGSVLRELGHVVLERPPEREWPENRGERARFKQALECRADAVVWQWGLRHYSMRHLAATYPPHWVDNIVKEIEKFLTGE